jgi:hypothetical protein
MGTEEHAVPWNKLTYDTSLGGYRTDIPEQQFSFLARSVPSQKKASLSFCIALRHIQPDWLLV